MESIMTLEEVAEFLRVSERTVKEWVNSGELPGGKLGSSWRFRRADIEQWTERKLTSHNYIHADAAASIIPQIYVHPERCLLFDPKSKDEALQKLIDIGSTVEGVQNRTELADAVFSREKLMSTGLGIELAIPHARLNGVDGVHAVIGITPKGIEDYFSIDGTTITIVVLLIIGRDQHCEYLKALSQLVELLKSEETRNSLKQAESAQEVYDLFIHSA